MICQHDPLLPNTTMQIQSNGQASRIICLECLRAAFITKLGMFIDADPPEHAIPAPETVPLVQSVCDRATHLADVPSSGKEGAP